MNNGFTINAGTVTLRPFILEDKPALAALTRQPEITDLLPDWKMTEQQLSEFLQFVVGSYERFDPQDVRIMLAVVHQESQQLVGWCGVFPNDMLDSSDREVAYAISRDYRNRGYITAAVGALTAYLFKHTSLTRIVGIVKTYNPASRVVLEHTGFRYVNRRRLSDGEDYDYFECIHSASGAMLSDFAEPNELIDPAKPTKSNEVIQPLIRLRRAKHEDAALLTDICTRAFDQAIRVWGNGEKDMDSNLCPPGYSLLRLHEYVIREWDYYVVEADGCAVGGVSVNVLGHDSARVDKIFIDPVCQGSGIGSQVIRQIEAEYPHIRQWRLETSGRQRDNHHFYEKLGYVCIYPSESEYVYEKIIETGAAEGKGDRLENVTLQRSEDGKHLMNSHKEFIQANLDSTWYSSSSMVNSRITDCNLSGSKLTNLNMTEMLLADLRLTETKFEFCALDGVQFQDIHLGSERVPMHWKHCDLGGSRFVDCDLSGVELERCQVAGMSINGVPVEQLFEAYEMLKKPGARADD
ncbi:GNAT family N-acetyltransferase [Paenibacillus silvae]|uniref:GNAT family N-acetyltransferase n=1 Tax=Paenibacillus silvae TaxID=1325358 RepID=UPI003CE6E847